MQKRFSVKELGFTKESKVLFVYPHPDDETFCNAGLIQKLLKIGAEPYVLCLTKGGASTLKFGVSQDKLLTTVREEEFISVMNLLDVKKYKICDFTDGGIENEEDLVTSCIKDVIAGFSPEFIVSYEPSGVYGHPDHVFLSKIVTDLTKELSLKLIYSTVAKGYKPSQGSLNMAKDPASVKPIYPNYILQLSVREYFKKLKCFSLYKSQFNTKTNLIRNLNHAFKLLNEYYYLPNN